MSSKYQSLSECAMIIELGGYTRTDAHMHTRIILNSSFSQEGIGNEKISLAQCK